jgi:hypothetical protein
LKSKGGLCFFSFWIPAKNSAQGLDAPPSKQAFSGAIHRVPKHVAEVAKKALEQVACNSSQLEVPSQL